MKAARITYRPRSVSLNGRALEGVVTVGVDYHPPHTAHLILNGVSRPTSDVSFVPGCLTIRCADGMYRVELETEAVS